MNKIWFPLENKSDLTNVLNFLDALPDNMYQFINKDTSNFIETYIQVEENEEGTLLLEAFNEAKEELTSALKNKRRRINLDTIIGDNTEARMAAEELRTIGFTGNSLKLKATLLNRIWAEIVEIVEKVGQGIMDFADNKLIKLVRKFLNLLNSMLASLKTFLPPLDGLKEIKEILENYMTFAEKE